VTSSKGTPAKLKAMKALAALGRARGA